MKNKKKIITIIVLSILLVLIVGISYAYFTAKVEGNEEAKNINVEAGKMNVKLIGPAKITAEYLVPSESKSITFKVENTGNVPAIYNLDMIEVKNEFDPTSDLVYTVTSDNDGGHVQDKEAPTENQTLIRNILIQPGKENIQTYTLTILFKETEINQNSNQNKTFEGRVQINSLEDKTMVTRIIRNNLLQTEEPDFTKGYPNEEDNDSSLSGLYAAQDDDGTSYYFRGDKNKINNNVKFGDLNWKIVRINGDGSVRLVLVSDFTSRSELSSIKSSMFTNYTAEGKAPYEKVGYTTDNITACTKENPCEVTYDGSNFSNAKFGGQSSDIKKTLETWYKGKLSTYDGKIAYGLFCNDTSTPGYMYDVTNTLTIYYGAYDRLSISSSSVKPTLQCPDPKDDSNSIRTYGGLYKTKIGLLTADEIAMAGYGSSSSSKATSSNYLYVGSTWWSLSPHDSYPIARIFTGSSGNINGGGSGATAQRAVVPVINLRSDVTFSGSGTETDPYLVS